MPGYSRTFGDLGETFHRLNQAGFLRRQARSGGRSGARAVPPPRRPPAPPRGDPRLYRRALDRPWTGTTAAARIARRFLLRFPGRDSPDPAGDLLTDRQAAARYHIEEAENEERYGRDFEW